MGAGSVSPLPARSHVGCGGSRALGKHLCACGSRRGLFALSLRRKMGIKPSQCSSSAQAVSVFFACLRTEHPDVPSPSYSCWFSPPFLLLRCCRMGSVIISWLGTQGSSSQLPPIRPSGLFGQIQSSDLHPLMLVRRWQCPHCRQQAGEDEPGATCRGSCCFWALNPCGFSLACRARQANASRLGAFYVGKSNPELLSVNYSDSVPCAACSSPQSPCPGCSRAAGAGQMQQLPP